MDRALKERIIGAAVLVVFAVLVVPVFLDGPPEEGEIVSERVPLPGQDAQEDTRTVVLERDRKEPVPAAADQATPEPSQQTAPQPQTVVVAETQSEPAQPAPDPVPQTPPAQTSPVDSSPTGMWAVQMGSFGNQENAERLAADLRKQGFAAFLSQLSTDAGQLHRVRIGPQKDRDSAEAVAASLQEAGHKGQVVPHP